MGHNQLKNAFSSTLVSINVIFSRIKLYKFT